jgi:predicted GNAT family acetyltransferase
VQITLTQNLDQFTKTAGSWLETSPVENNVLLTMIAAQRAGFAKGSGPATYGWVAEDCSILGALRWPPPMPVRVTAMPATAAVALADELAARALPLPGISGPRETVDVFVKRWCELTGQTAGHVRDLLIYQLGEKKLTAWPPGRMRPALADEAELLTEWTRQLFAGTGMRSPEEAARQQIKEQLSGGRLYVWEDEGMPVAVTGHAEPVCGVVRINAGYSPPEHRTSWYGTGLWAALATHLLDQGCAACIGMADGANPYAGAGTRVLGITPVVELSEYRFA